MDWKESLLITTIKTHHTTQKFLYKEIKIFQNTNWIWVFQEFVKHFFLIINFCFFGVELIVSLAKKTRTWRKFYYYYTRPNCIQNLYLHWVSNVFLSFKKNYAYCMNIPENFVFPIVNRKNLAKNCGFFFRIQGSI